MCRGSFNRVSSADDVEFTKVCAESTRFGDIRIANYVDTIVGWKEDFMISYTRVSSQERALEYARKVISENESVVILGHSKGANLALYSAAYLGDEYQEKLKKVYLNDGPGFCSDIPNNGQLIRIYWGD